ncbi:organic hydroperoxide resistance protein [Brochothrix campestris]|uniref:Organic hydroperoxide resistance protein-like 2 n=1 Tax=Brochothrix campestris FSL F6-1037 TaxID=1265861 RepID=W7CXK8_9LIST|nr:organic hydroperoxide resistance protein [Brochothrix campestris]EUJ40491.1 Organic hydroperoxide resistance protein-like 2 [Brochothrix campestris FSL F6-1037]
MKKLYETTIINTGGRSGEVSSPDNIFYYDISAPTELGGDGGSGTNPEQLFAAGYSACFNSALEVVMQRAQIKTTSTVTGTVTLYGDPVDNGFKIGVILDVQIANVDHETAQALVAKAHDVCPYSKATRGNIDVTLNVVD